MSRPTRYAIIGSGAAGTEAALQLRTLDPTSEITIVTASKLQFISRYDLPSVFQGIDDWRDLLVHPPAFYAENRITVRRNTWVASVDPRLKTLTFRHRESMPYDKLLVASGGGGYVPEGLREYAALMNPFSSFENAIRLRDNLGNKGKVAILGGDMVGLDLARHLTGAGHKVTVYASQHLFWPHEYNKQDISPFLAALKHMGVEVNFDRIPVAVEALPASNSRSAGGGIRFRRRLKFERGEPELVHAVMPFHGLMPALGFMHGTGVDIERGLLVNPQLRTTNDHIWAAGDVCQIWSPEENHYSFFYGWNNVKEMGRIAARNMTGSTQEIETTQCNELLVARNGDLTSPYWEHS